MKRRDFLNLLTGVVAGMAIHPWDFLTPAPVNIATGSLYGELLEFENRALTPNMLEATFEYFDNLRQNAHIVVSPSVYKQYNLLYGLHYKPGQTWVYK